MSILRSVEIPSRMENRSGEVLCRETERFDPGETGCCMPFAVCVIRGETPLRVEREEVPLGEGFERVIGMITC
jgi:hypothetical protein